MLWKIVMVFACVLLAQFCHGLKNERMKLIIDTDAGSDDAVGIFLALAVKEIDVVAITCTFGNTQEANVETNVLKIMTIAKRSDVPIYAGATRPLLQNYTQSYYFGKDGLGDFATDIKPIGTIDRTKHASIAMIELARKYPGEISVVVLGPPTNVALAASLDSNFTRNIKRFHVMGARIKLPKYIVNRMVQFNFGLDVDSVAIFLNSKTQLKTRVITSDLAHSNTINKKWRQEVLGKSNSTRIQFLNKVEALVLNRSLDWAVADSITVAATIWPELVTSSYEAHMSAITCHPFKGLVSVSVNDLDSKDKNVEIGKTFDSAAFKDKLLKYLA